MDTSRISCMQVGIHKCGIMSVGGANGNQVLEAEPERWCIGGQRIPIVEEYRYLGIIFNAGLQVDEMMRERFVSGRKLVAKLVPFLRTQSIPLKMRTAVVKTVVMPTLLFGSEIYGMNKAITSKMQVFLNQSLKALAGVSLKAPVANVALWREFDIPPVCASAAARRARAWSKCGASHTWMSELVTGHMKTKYWTWITGTKRWLSRYLVAYVNRMLRPQKGQDRIHDWLELPTKIMTNLVSCGVWEREEWCFRCPTAMEYVQAKYEAHRVFRIGGMHHPALNSGLNAIVKCRMGGFWTARRLATCHLIAARYMNQCPCCRGPVAEDMYHILWTCPRWDQIRAQWLRPLLVDPTLRLYLQPPDPMGIVTLLLGGEYMGNRMRNWNPPRHNRDGVHDENINNPEDRAEDARSDESSSDGEDDYNVVFDDLGEALSSCFQVARYLAEVIRARAPIIRNLRPNPQG